RSFLQKSECCPDGFKVDLSSAHKMMAIACFRCLSKRNPDRFFDYARSHLMFHLDRASPTSDELLACIHRFFDELQLVALLPYYGVNVNDIPALTDAGAQSLDISIEDPFIHSTLRWLSEWKRKRCHRETEDDMQSAVIWCHE